MVYLRKNPPARSQYRSPRREDPSGLIVIHTAESALDSIGPDSGAENVAAFIARRTDAPGSYHILADSDSRIRLVRFTDEAYGDGTGSNPFAIHISAACRTTDWKTMSADQRKGFIEQMAGGAAVAAKWVKKNYGVTVPSKRITKVQSDERKPGFITHAERDPSRRSDPGADFPWDDFLAEFSRRMGYDNPDDSKLTPLVVEARKKYNTAVVANNQAARAARAAANEADRIGRKKLATNIRKRAAWSTKQAKAIARRRKWFKGRVQWLRKQK